jgi:glycosyltransferase A (GT-A) superfamily protein (DUF2064 family)
MAQLLVVAKAPVPGRVKTRLGHDIGMAAAADVAAASLLDTLAACVRTIGVENCHLSLDGELFEAKAGDRLEVAIEGWTVRPQRGDGLAERLANAHAEVPGPVVQVGMDTPQLTVDLLSEVIDGLSVHDAVLGPAEDGGWWVLAVRDPASAAALVGVPMSTPTTYADTRAALGAAGLRVGGATVLRDVDTVADAEAVAALAPESHFAAAWARTSPRS